MAYDAARGEVVLVTRRYGVAEVVTGRRDCHAAGEEDFWWASLIFRATSFTLVALTALALRSSVRISRGDAAYVSAVGLGDMLGNVLFAASAGFGLVSVTSVLASLYPIVTVVLARVVLSERVDRGQEVGIGATLAGVVLISAG